MTPDERAAHIKKLVDEAPPLPEETKSKLRAIFATAVRP